MRIDIKGSIVPDEDKWIYDWLDWPATAPKDVLKSLEDAGAEAVDVYINSPGGEIFAGSEIYAALQAHPGEVKLHIVGQACSAASVIACAGRCDMVRTGMLMIHNVQSGASGDHRDMTHEAQVLHTADRAICAAYVAKTGKSEDELLDLMAQETWMTAQEALGAGFIDAIAEPVKMQLVASAGGLLSAEVIGRLRGMAPRAMGKAETLQAKLKMLALRLPPE